MAGVDLPVVPLRRQILVTEPMPPPVTELVPPSMPMTIDFSSTFYLHREGPAILLGMSDPDEQPGFRLERDDAWLPRLTAAIEHRAPALLDLGIAHGWAGLYEMTPDHNALIGESGRVRRFLYATGFSGHGFLQGPAVGEVIATWCWAAGRSSTCRRCPRTASPAARPAPRTPSSDRPATTAGGGRWRTHCARRARR